MASARRGLNCFWPEDGNAPIDDGYTYKLNQSFFRRPFEVYDLKSYSDLVYFAGYDEATGTCDMVIVDTLVNTQFEDNVLPVDDNFYRTVRYPGSSMNAKETWMDQFTPYSPTDKAMDSLFLVNEAESELDENDNLVYTISGMQGGSTASYTFAANARMLTMRADYVGESDHYSSLGAPVQWSAARAAGEEYNFSDAAAAEGKKVTFPQRFQTTELPEILPGDMAYITLDSSNKVSSFIYIGNCNEIPDYELHYRPKMHGMYIGVCFEPVFFLDDNYIGMVGNKNYVTDRQQLTGQPVYYWDFADQEFKKASVSDLYVSTDDISSAGYANNLWVAANRKNWQITEMVMVDYNLIGQKK